jgi:hypothetical protein
LSDHRVLFKVLDNVFAQWTLLCILHLEPLFDALLAEIVHTHQSRHRIIHHISADAATEFNEELLADTSRAFFFFLFMGSSTLLLLR